MQVAVEESHHFPCRQCGADLRFAPEQGRLVCDHCGFGEDVNGTPRKIAPPSENPFRPGLDAALSDEAEAEDLRFSKCPNCGAEVTLDAAVHAADCPFCATPVVADTGARRQIKPGGIVPFLLPEHEARKAMADWLGRLWFAPGGLVDYARKGRMLQGIYMPYWTFDADTRSSYEGRRGTVYYETERVHVQDGRGGRRSETRRVAKVRWTPVAGRVARFFDDVLILASEALPESHTTALMPWDLSQLQPYAPHYLAGFRANGYSVPLDTGYGRARAWMDRMIERDIRFDIGGDRQVINHVNTDVSGVTFKHVLLPVWTAAYRYRGKSYRFVVNGQTGRVQGERPWSVVKIAFAVLAGAALVVAAAAALQYARQQGLIGQ
ncbi:MAG: primosomal protein N' (replication factor Y) - superfamily II helicase [Rhodobacteraceae bacterium]|nr:primosomal protein N' (replication factor Y) - superfamily II helicase [Paracoccaceae bacterium]